MAESMHVSGCEVFTYAHQSKILVENICFKAVKTWCITSVPQSPSCAHLISYSITPFHFFYSGPSSFFSAGGCFLFISGGKLQQTHSFTGKGLTRPNICARRPIQKFECAQKKRDHLSRFVCPLCLREFNHKSIILFPSVSR